MVGGRGQNRPIRRHNYDVTINYLLNTYTVYLPK